MVRLLTLIFLVAASPAQTAVPVEQDPRHRQVFVNEHIRVLDVTIQPGDATAMHTHVYDSVGIKLTAAQVTVEVQGGSSSIDVVKRGAVGFSRLTGPVTHKVSNTGTTQFRTIVVELLQPARERAAPSPLTTANDGVLVDNDRVRISRVVLLPGQSIERQSYQFPGIRVVVRGELIDTGTSRGIKPGDFEWHERGVEYSVKNISAEPFEAVNIELK